jgi:hypothetical protein
MSDALVSLPANFASGGAHVDPAVLKAVLDQLRNVSFLALASGGGGITATVKSTLNLADASADTLQVDARIGGEHGDNIRIKTVRLTSTAGESVFDLEVYYPDDSTLVETFKAVSMLDTHARYVETVVNSGLRSEPASEWIRVTDLDSATGDDRPSDAGPTQLASGANEATLTGLVRGDNIAAIYNVTDTAAIAASDFAVANTNKVVSTAGVAGSKDLLLLVLPK